MTRRDVTLKLNATRALIRKLPAARRAYWSHQLFVAESRAAGRTAVGADAGAEWDLSLANWLDGVYTAVATEATKTRKELVNATGETAWSLGLNMWPLALAALAVGYAVSKGRGR